MRRTKQFAFLYPIPEIINFEIKNHGWQKEGGVETFRKRYRDLLNQCIDQRYRQKGFSINYIVFKGNLISEIICLQPEDRIIRLALDYKTHISKRIYPDPDEILNQLPEPSVLRVAGFHMWDCVEKLAKRAYEKGLNVLVDEDLTEFFAWRLNDSNFAVDRYPTYTPGKDRKHFFREFMATRQERPWLWQHY